MAHITEDRVLESTTTTGTGPITLAGAVVAFRRFSAVCAIGDTAPYFIEAVDSLGQPTGDYEYGIGTYSAANQITRTKVQGSSNAGAAVNFVAGNKNVGMPALAGSVVPTGAIIDFACAAAPTGYVELDGALLSRLQYPSLWSHAQASGNIAASDGAWTEGQWSPGDGATTFRTPNHRGRFRRGWDHGRGVDAGRAIGSSQADAFQGHRIDYNTASVSANPGTPFTGVVVGNPTSTEGATGVVRLGVSTISNDGVNGVPRTAAETRPANVAVLTCVKY